MNKKWIAALCAASILVLGAVGCSAGGSLEPSATPQNTGSAQPTPDQQIPEETAPPEETQEPSASNAAAFSMDDLVLMGVKHGAAGEDVKAVLGEPDSVDSLVEAASGTAVETWTYGNNTVELRDGVLSGATISDELWTGPRDIRIGDSAEKVLASFLNEQEGSNILYSAQSADGTMTPPPMGEIIEDDGSGYYEISYVVPAVEGDERAAYEENVASDPQSYVFWPLGLLSITVDSGTQMVTDIGWSIAPFAE